MTAPALLLLADDLTGAADSAGAFALAGLTTLISFAPGPLPAADVLVIATDSRHLSPAQAAARNRAALKPLRGDLSQCWLYKKIDSTLRGQPGAELAALMTTLGRRRVLIAPAFPAQGRTTIGGRQHVDGHPLTETPFGREVSSSEVAARFQPYLTGQLQTLKTIDIDLATVRRNHGTLQKILERSGPIAAIADAETDDDLQTLVRAAAAAGLRLLCGSAGLARAMQQTLTFRVQIPPPALPLAPSGPILLVAGSRHPTTAEQIQRCCEAGFALVPASSVLNPNRTDDALTTDVVIQATAAALAAGRDVVLTTAGLPDSILEGAEIARRLGLTAQAILAKQRPGGMILTGGDIALAVCEALGSSTLLLQAEVEAGIPLGQLIDGPYAGLPVVTKAGGFGSPQALVRAVDMLHDPLR